MSARTPPCRAAGRGRAPWIAALALAAAVALPLAAPAMVGGAASRRGSAPGCPYDFLSEMPAGTFCVYRGRATGAHGTLCDGDAVVLWRTHARRPVDVAAAPSRHVYFGFLDRPSLLVRAVAERRTEAHIVAYQLAPAAVPVDLHGTTTLGGAVAGPRMLILNMPATLPPARGREPCATALYRGEFIGTVDLASGAPPPSCSIP